MSPVRPEPHPTNPTGQPLTCNVDGCARCEGDHRDVVFQPLAHPIVVEEATPPVIATHWAPCPTNGEPILMSTKPSTTFACRR